jgi:homopolymeric O-antigen transport system ATP-binding protein
MSDIAIRCENLSKRYRIGKREHYRVLRDVLTEAMYAPFRRIRSAFQGNNGKPADSDDKIWALRDVSFEIKHGEVAGIIGRNGAGKSTLLKILSRITEPTRGEVRLHGRVGSLLEVGTGFHPELTGRENIYLNGAILGMKRAEIERKFDEIVAFADVEKFLDTPVKFYSSGMYMRLAFAVAAHLETEILLVDEVLAVGDLEFQKKCLAKMRDIGQSGRAVLFVSHSMPSIQRLCSKGILLSGGRVEGSGPVDQVVDQYLSFARSSTYVDNSQNGKPRITEANVRWEEQKGIVLQVSFDSPTRLSPVILGFVIYDSFGLPVFGSNPKYDLINNSLHSGEKGTIQVEIATESLRYGTYDISLWLGDMHADYCHLDRGLSVTIGMKESETGLPPRHEIGNISLPTKWQYLCV